MESIIEPYRQFGSLKSMDAMKSKKDESPAYEEAIEEEAKVNRSSSKDSASGNDDVPGDE